MTDHGDDLIPTRATLLGRLKNSKDRSSWQEFFDTYSKLIYGVALKAGLDESGARDVLKTTMEAVAERMPTFRYDSRFDSFKTWLRNLTRLQIISLTLKRRPSSYEAANAAFAMDSESSGQTVDQVWDQEWESNLLEAAVVNVKRRLDPKKYQVYDFCVNKGWASEKVAAAFGISVDEVRLAKDNITGMIKVEVRRLEQEML